MAIAVKNTNETLYIDSRSYQAFEFNGEKLLFDRATGTTCEINDIVFDLLVQCKSMTLDDSIDLIQKRYPEVDAEEIRAFVAQLKQQGFFRFTPVDMDAQNEALEMLWRHKPRRIQLLMAQSCNLGCRYCYAWRNGSNQRNTLMPFETAKAGVDYLVRKSKNRRNIQVTFFGGEPLLNYEVLKRTVAYCREIEKRSDKEFVFELITNGTLLDKAKVDFLVENAFLLFISIDGWKEMHNYNRPSLNGDTNMHDTIVANAQYANEQYKKHKLPRIKVRANLTNKYHDTRRVAKYLEGLGFQTIGIGAIEPLPHGNPSPAAMTEDQVDELHERSNETLIQSFEALKEGKKLGPYESSRFQKAIRQIQPRPTLGITCGIARNTATVDTKGSILPCHRYEGMDAYIIGNVWSGLDRERTMNYYRKVVGHATENCHDCWIRDFCRGGCAWLLSDKEGHIHHPTPRECSRRRKSVERALWLRKQMRAHFPEKFSEATGELQLEQWEWTAEGDAAKAAGSNSCATCSSQGCGSDVNGCHN